MGTIDIRRAGIVDGPVLLHALKSWRLHGAALDAIESEPPWFTLTPSSLSLIISLPFLTSVPPRLRAEAGAGLRLWRPSSRCWM